LIYYICTYHIFVFSISEHNTLLAIYIKKLADVSEKDVASIMGIKKRGYCSIIYLDDFATPSQKFIPFYIFIVENYEIKNPTFPIM